MYGLSNYILSPPFSLILSIIISLGITFIGYLVINKSKFKILFSNYEYKNFFSPLIGSYIIIFFIYPFLFSGLLNKNFFILVSFSLFILGLIFLFLHLSKIRKINFLNIISKFSNKLDLLLVILFLIGLLIIIFSETTLKFVQNTFLLNIKLIIIPIIIFATLYFLILIKTQKNKIFP